MHVFVSRSLFESSGVIKAIYIYGAGNRKAFWRKYSLHMMMVFEQKFCMKFARVFSVEIALIENSSSPAVWCDKCKAGGREIIHKLNCGFGWGPMWRSRL